MPSLRTRIQYDRIVLQTAGAAIADAAEALAETTETIEAANGNLEAIAEGTFDLEAIRIGGQRFINNGGVLELEV